MVVCMRAMHWSLLIGARRGQGLTKKNDELQNVTQVTDWGEWGVTT